MGWQKKKKNDRTENERRIAELAARMHPKRVLFLEHWLGAVPKVGPNPPSRTDAMRKAGYGGNDFSLRRGAHKIMQEPDSQEYISRRLRGHVNADEVLAMIVEAARADWKDYCELDEEGNPIPKLKAIWKAGKMHMVEGVEFKKDRWIPKMMSQTQAQSRLLDFIIAGSKRKGIDPQDFLDRLPDVFVYEGTAVPLKEIILQVVLASVEEEKALPGS